MAPFNYWTVRPHSIVSPVLDFCTAAKCLLEVNIISISPPIPSCVAHLVLNLVWVDVGGLGGSPSLTQCSHSEAPLEICLSLGGSRNESMQAWDPTGVSGRLPDNQGPVGR